MIPRGCESRSGTPITLIAIHTAEGATTAQSLAHYLDGSGVEASYHKLVDDTQVITYLFDETQAAWAMLSGNHRSVQLCFTGFAKWPATEWLAHDNMLHLGAAEVARWCARYSIPATHLTPTQVGADWWGICGHWDWTLGKRDGTHTDPGPNFPWEYFISLVRSVGVNIPVSTPMGGIPDMRYGEQSNNVLRLQQFMTSKFQSYNKYVPTGFYGDATKAGIAEFQRRTGITGGDGANIGPQTKAQLAKYGLVW